MYLLPNIFGLAAIFLLPIILPLPNENLINSKTEVDNGRVPANGHAQKIK